MNVFDSLETFLYQLSALFFYPVILALLILLGRLFYSLGNFCREAFQRVRGRGLISRFAGSIRNLPEGEPRQRELALAELLRAAEQRSVRPIQQARYSVKMGPTLGLIGTLTPMAKALSSLSEGNLAGLSSQMITAFSTTVLGLIIGSIAFSILHVRLKWQRQDLHALSVLAEEKLRMAD